MKKVVSVLIAAFCLPVLAEAPKVDGKALYASKCAACHGADGVAKPMGKGSANFNDPAYTASVDEIVKVTLEGKGKMPKYVDKLKPEEVRAIAEHVKTMAPPKK